MMNKAQVTIGALLDVDNVLLSRSTWATMAEQRREAWQVLQQHPRRVVIPHIHSHLMMDQNLFM